MIENLLHTKNILFKRQKAMKKKSYEAFNCLTLSYLIIYGEKL